jgi:hypothetical protein
MRGIIRLELSQPTAGSGIILLASTEKYSVIPSHHIWQKQHYTKGYKQFRSIIVPLVQQKMLQQLQLQQQKSKGIDLEL